MPLTCECSDDSDWYYESPNDYTTLTTSKRKRCVSCRNLIELNAICLEFECWRRPVSEIEENIEGDQIYLASKYMCEECGDIFFSLEELGFCLYLNEPMKDLLDEYHEAYGKPDV